MTKIDEWTPVFPRKEELSKSAAGASAPAKSAPNPVDAIYAGLMKLKPQPPFAVHCYLGEGLRWIRVGFGGEEPLTPAFVSEVGRRIESCIPDRPLFFNALRPHDMLFFLEDGELASIGLPPTHFGVPLDKLLRAWQANGPVAARKKAHSMSDAPYSQRSRAKR